MKRFRGHADSGIKRKKLKNVVYFGDLYRGKDNEKLWSEVKEYIGKQYGTEKNLFPV